MAVSIQLHKDCPLQHALLYKPSHKVQDIISKRGLTHQENLNSQVDLTLFRSILSILLFRNNPEGEEVISVLKN